MVTRPATLPFNKGLYSGIKPSGIKANNRMIIDAMVVIIKSEPIASTKSC